jgi:hypothetical protein
LNIAVGNLRTLTGWQRLKIYIWTVFYPEHSFKNVLRIKLYSTATRLQTMQTFDENMSLYRGLCFGKYLPCEKQHAVAYDILFWIQLGFQRPLIHRWSMKNCGIKVQTLALNRILHNDNAILKSRLEVCALIRFAVI